MTMLQSIYQESVSQVYPIGMPHRRDDRTFRYCQAGDALASAYGAQTYNAFSSAVVRETAAIAAAGVAGDRTLLLTAQGDVTVNMFRGGYACIYWEFSYYRIIANTAATAGNTFTVTL